MNWPGCSCELSLEAVLKFPAVFARLQKRRSALGQPPYRQIWAGLPALTATSSLALWELTVILKQLLRTIRLKPQFSPLRAGIGARLALAGVAAGLLWFAVVWALL